MKNIVQLVQNLLKPYIDSRDRATQANIAPVETDATSASKAYTVGEQLILNNVLYDVTAPISLGDALVAEGAGANIAAADDITTQIKNHTVTTDAVPTKNSTNPVQSGGVYSADANIYAVMGRNGARNLLLYDLDSIKALNTLGTWNGNVYTRNGIDYTVNNDGSITVNGTNTGSSSMQFYLIGDNSNPSGFKLSGTLLATAGEKISNDDYLRIGITNGTYYNITQERELTFPDNSDIYVTIRVNGNSSIDNKTIYPMVRQPEDNCDTFSPPFAKTNAQLTAENQTLLNYANSQSNPNLLDNPWFTVNQRGLDNYSYSSDSKHYSFDRWVLGASGVSISKSNDIFTVSAMNSFDSFTQLFPIDYIKEGDTYTLSVLFDDDTIESRTFVANAANPRFLGTWTHGDNKFNAIVTGQYSNQWQVIPFDYTGSNVETPVTISFKAIKLEKGSVSTLAMDTAPNYQQELAKCQRYYYRIGDDGYNMIGYGPTHDGVLSFMTFLPVPMRDTPTISLDNANGNLYFQGGGTVYIASSITYRKISANANVIYMDVTPTQATTGQNFMAAWLDPNAALEFSADL